MKKFITLLAAMLLLTGCGNTSAEEPETTTTKQSPSKSFPRTPASSVATATAA